MSNQYIPSSDLLWINRTSMQDLVRGIDVQFDTNTGKFRHRVVYNANLDDDPQIYGEWVDGKPRQGHVKDNDRRKPTCERPSKVAFMD